MPRFLHLSDLHFQKNNTTQKEIITALLKDIDKQNKEGRIQFVLFSGDLVQSGSKEHFNEFYADVAEPIMETLELPMNRLFVVPGNHDLQIYDDNISSENQKDDLEQKKQSFSRLVDNNEIEKSVEKISNNNYTSIEKILMNRFEPFNKFKSKLYCSGVKETDSNEINPFFSVHKFKMGSYMVGIACFNSCFSCFGEKSKDSIGDLYFPMVQIIKAVQSLKNVQIKIAMFHHPIFWFKEWVNSDSQRIERELIEKFDFILYGHIHEEDSRQKDEEGDCACFCQGGYLSLRGKNISTYSIISFNDPNQIIEGKIHFRELTNNVFDTKLSVYNNGYKPFRIEKNERTFSEYTKSPLKINKLLSPDEFFKKVKPSDQRNDTLKSLYKYDYSNKVYMNKSIANVNFSSVDFSGANFSGTQFRMCHFSDVNMNNANFNGCIFKNVDFTHMDSFFSVAYSKKTNLLCVGGIGALAFFLCDNNGISKTVVLKNNFQKVLSLAWHDEILAMSSSDGSISLWNPDKLSAPLEMVKESNTPVYAIVWSPNGRYIATTYNKTSVRIYEVECSDNKYKLNYVTTLNDSYNRTPHLKQILTLSWSPDGKWLVSAGIDKIINVWSIENINEYHHNRKFINSHFDYVRKVIWNKNSESFISCSDDGFIKFWGIAEDDLSFSALGEFSVLPGEDNNDVLSMALSPKTDKNIIAAGLRDDQIAIIEYSDDFSNIELLCVEKVHKGRVWDVCWDEKGERIFSVGNEGKLKVCPVKEGLLDYKNSIAYEVKISCSNLEIHNAKGLNVKGYLVTENKDMPEKNVNGTLGEFLSSRGAVGYEKD